MRDPMNRTKLRESAVIAGSFVQYITPEALADPARPSSLPALELPDHGLDENPDALAGVLLGLRFGVSTIVDLHEEEPPRPTMVAALAMSALAVDVARLLGIDPPSIEVALREQGIDPEAIP